MSDYKGYSLTVKQNEAGDHKVIIHAKWLQIDETEWWANEEDALFDAKGRIEQRLRDKEMKK